MESYKSLVAWQRASCLSAGVLDAIEQNWKPRAKIVFDQLGRAALSTDLNIVEGYALGTPLLFRKHVRIAMGSTAETERLLQLSGQRAYLPGAETTRLLGIVSQLFPALVGLFRKPHSVRKWL